MKINLCIYLVMMLTLLGSPLITLGQSKTPNLGAASSFALFTVAGALSNTGGLTGVVGDVGTNVGDMSGFPQNSVVGQTAVANSVSASAATDVQTAYHYLTSLTGPAAPAITPAMGNGQTLTPNMYRFGGAASVNGTLILDGQNNPNSVFVFQINGALTVAAASQVILINSATPNNIFWQVNGAASMAANTAFAGIIVANGAVSFGDMASLQGKGLSIAGAVNTYNTQVTSSNSSTRPLPVELTRFTAVWQAEQAQLSWTTASEKNSAYFAVERSSDGHTFTRLGRVAGQGTTAQAHTYTWTDARAQQSATTLFYRLRQVDNDSTATYSPVRTVVTSAATDQLALQAYPNPFQQQLDVRLATTQTGPATVRLTDALGHVVAQRTLEVTAGSLLLVLDELQSLPTGLYLLDLQQAGQHRTLRVVRQ